MNKHDPIIGRYVYVTCQGKSYRTYYEEAGEGITLMRVDMPDAGTVVFYYRARDPAEPGDIGATVDLNAAPGAADNCAAFDPWFRQGVAQVVFDYTHPNGGVRETLSGAACRGVSA